MTPIALDILPTDHKAKTGCMYCPLFVSAAAPAEFPAYYEKGAEDHYQRNAESILSKQADHHEVKTHRMADYAKADAHPEGVDVLFVLEAPSRDEDRSGRTLAGRAGKLLEGAIKEMLPGRTYAVAYVAGCRSFRSKEPGKTVKQSCAPHFLNQLEAFKPKAFAAVGGFAMEALAGQKGILTLNGAVLRACVAGFEGVPVVPVFTPEMVLFADHNTEAFMQAIGRLNDVLDGKVSTEAVLGDYYVLEEAEQVEAMVDAFIADGLPVAYDTETGRLSPHVANGYPHLLCFSFSNEERVGYTVPYDHVESPFALPHEPPDFPIPEEPKRRWLDKEKTKRTAGSLEYDAAVAHRDWYMQALAKLHENLPARKAARARVKAALIRLFKSGLTFIAQNAKFDQQHIRLALGASPKDPHDTMLHHMVLDDRPGTHGLKTIAYRFTEMGGYDAPLEKVKDDNRLCDPDKGGSYACIPGSILFKYAGADTDCTLQCNNRMEEDRDYRRNPRWRDLAELFLPRLSETLARMEYAGAQVNVDVVLKMKADLEPKVRQLEADIAGHPTILKFRMKNRDEKGNIPDFNPNSPTQLQNLFFGFMGIDPIALTDTGESALTYRWEEAQKKDPNCNFGDIIAQAVARGEWKHFATDAATLEDIATAEQDEGLVELILDYRAKSKLLGTYVMPMIEMRDEQSRIHGSFHVSGTRTGRLASSKPNLQNIPGDAKHAYVSRWGAKGMLLQADYSQIELRVAASWFGEPQMVKAYVDGLDLHALTAQDISGLPPEQYKVLDEKTKKGWRTRAKRINFGILYGAGPPALRKTLKKDGVFITEEESKDLIRKYFETRPGLKAGLDRTMELARKQGYLETYTGRRRRLPEVFASDNSIVSRALRQSTNFPIQSGASDMTLLSLILIDDALREYGMESILMLTVHDSIILDCPEHEVVEAARLVTTVMENIPQLAGELVPHADWSWLNCPIKAEVEAGRTWGAMVGFDMATMGETDSSEPLWFKNKEGKDEHRAPVSYKELLTLADEVWKKVA